MKKSSKIIIVICIMLALATTIFLSVCIGETDKTDQEGWRDKGLPIPLNIDFKDKRLDLIGYENDFWSGCLKTGKMGDIGINFLSKNIPFTFSLEDPISNISQPLSSEIQNITNQITMEHYPSDLEALYHNGIFKNYYMEPLPEETSYYLLLTMELQENDEYFLSDYLVLYFYETPSAYKEECHGGGVT